MSTAPIPFATVGAVTRAVDPPENLLDALGPDGIAWLRDGVGFVTAGIAARVAPEAARAWLAEIDHDDEVGGPGTGPLAVGALPFDPGAPGELLVPQRIVGRDAAGRAWVTELGPPVRATSEPGRVPTTFTVREQTSRAAWGTAVAAALDAIARGELEKVVLARRVDVDGDRPFEIRTILQRLCDQQPGCFVYASDGMVGASPELLVRRLGTSVESQPMAGTSILTDDAALARLRASAKDAREHRPVVDAIVATLEPLCRELDVGAVPEVARFASVAHLVTSVRGTLRVPTPDVVAIALALHPTPAVGGTPCASALAAIAALEEHPRDRYAGPVGWMDARGDGEWAVALRGASVEGARATLHAGAGIVAGSVAEDEWCEAQAKLEPMIHALVG